MTRRRWVYTMGGNPLPEPVEVTVDFQSRHERNGTCFMVDRFMEGDRATDGTDIGSRSKRRDYMRAHGLADAGDYTNVWERARAEKEARVLGKAPLSREIVEEVGRVAYELKQRRGRK